MEVKMNIIYNNCSADEKEVVYILTFKTDDGDKYYVGKTLRQLGTRIKEHCKPSNGCILLQRAIQKYQEFSVEVIYRGDKLSFFEQYFIDYLQSHDVSFGYNLTLGGEGCKHNDETRRKISESLLRSDKHRGHHISEEHKKAISEFNKGKVLSEETKQRMSQAKMGHEVSDDVKRKMSESRKGKTGARYNSYKVLASPSGLVFNSVADAMRYFCISVGHSSRYISTGKVHLKSGQTFTKLL